MNSIRKIANLVLKKDNLLKVFKNTTNTQEILHQEHQILSRHAKHNNQQLLQSQILLYPKSTKIPYITLSCLFLLLTTNSYHHYLQYKVTHSSSIAILNDNVAKLHRFTNKITLRPKDVLEYEEPLRALQTFFLNESSTIAITKTLCFSLTSVFLERVLGSPTLLLYYLLSTIGLNSAACLFSSHPDFPLDSRFPISFVSILTCGVFFSRCAIFRNASIPMAALCVFPAAELFSSFKRMMSDFLEDEGLNGKEKAEKSQARSQLSPLLKEIHSGIQESALKLEALRRMRLEGSEDVGELRRALKETEEQYQTLNEKMRVLHPVDTSFIPEFTIFATAMAYLFFSGLFLRLRLRKNKSNNV